MNSYYLFRKCFDVTELSALCTLSFDVSYEQKRLIHARACVCVCVAANIFEFLMADLNEINSLYRFGFVLILIHLLTAIGLPPGGSSTVHIYTQTIHRTTQNFWKCAGSK